MTADEIERITMGHLRLLRDGCTKHRAARLEGEIVALHETLVRNLAWYFRRRYVYQTSTIDDLYQAGRMGVLSAVRSFDPLKSQVFGPRAYMHIRKALQKATIEDRLVRMPQTDKNKDDFWAPPLAYGKGSRAATTAWLDRYHRDAGSGASDVAAADVQEFGDVRDDVESIARAREVARYDLDKPSKVTVRKLRRRLRQQGLA